MTAARWMLVAGLLAGPLLAAAPAVRAERPPARALGVGDSLPSLRGRDLTGADVELPRDLRGRGAFLALGFTRQSRVQVEAWTERFRKEHGADPAFTFFKVPVLGGSARMARPFIDSGMKKGTPPALHRNVISVWSEAGEWKARMGYRRPDDAYVALVDRGGRLAWRHAGPVDEAAWTALGEAMARLD